MLEADLPVDPPVQFGSMQAYALCTVRNYVMMAIHAGCSDDQVFGMVVDGIDRATAARLVGRSSGEAGAASGQGTTPRRRDSAVWPSRRRRRLGRATLLEPFVSLLGRESDTAV